MSSFSVMLCFWFFSCIIFLALIHPAISDDSLTPSYKDYCSSVVPQSSPTSPTYNTSLPYLTTSYFTGGDQLLGLGNNYTFYYGGRYVRLGFLPRCQETKSPGVYKVDAFFYVYSPYASDYYYDATRGNYTFGGSYNYSRRRRSRVKFSLTGFWSEVLRETCMVGAASVNLRDGRTSNVAGVLKLKFASENPTLGTSVDSGTFESTSAKGHPGFFDTISVLNFLDSPHYNYTILLDETGNVSDGRPLVLEPSQFCNALSWRSTLFDMEYAANCTDRRHCSPLGIGAMPKFLKLIPIHCSMEGRRMRYQVRFQNETYNAIDESFTFNSMLIAEGIWDEKKGRMFVHACRILDPIDHFGEPVGDCGIRLSIKYPSVLSIRDDSRIVGELWSNGNANDKGYFRKIKLSGDEMIDMNGMLKYEYTQVERARKLCAVKKPGKKSKGKTYPDVESNDMRFDASVMNSKGEHIARGYMTPLFIGNKSFHGNAAMYALAPSSTNESLVDAEVATMSEAEERDSVSVFNISYKISITPYFDFNFSKWNVSMNHYHQMMISAEGTYNVQTGQLCMVGCRKLQNSSMDCEILVKFEIPPLNARRGELIRGTVTSTRPVHDPLHFEDLTLSAAAYYTEMAEASIWRMDWEITLVLASNTLFCIFVGLQLFHVKRHPETVASISLVMVLILALGHMIPLVLNMEAIFLENHSKQTVFLSSGGWVEGNEVVVRIMTMVAFLLQIRLLQLVWNAKQDPCSEKSFHIEGKALLITLPAYILGAVFTILLNWVRNQYGGRAFRPYGKYSLWGDLRSYVGLILDGFLLPQIVLNAVRGSTEKALCHSFFVGTSALRLVPHAYNEYRARSYPAPYVNGTYYYANPAGDFYSTAWDVVIPMGVVAMAAVVFVQQWRGGRWILPKRFRELELYAKLPTVDNQRETNT